MLDQASLLGFLVWCHVGTSKQDCNISTLLFQEEEQISKREDPRKCGLCWIVLGSHYVGTSEIFFCRIAFGAPPNPTKLSVASIAGIGPLHGIHFNIVLCTPPLDLSVISLTLLNT